MNYKEGLNQTAGLGLGGVPGPYTYKGDIRFFAIDMHHNSRLESLRHYVQKYVGERHLPLDVRVRLDDDSKYFYLVSTVFGTQSGGTNVGLDSVRSVFFQVPVEVTICHEVFYAYVQLFTFNETLAGVLTNREMRGINGFEGRIRTPRTRPRRNERDEYSEQQAHEIFLEDLRGDQNAKSKVVLSLVTDVSDFVGLAAGKRRDTLLEIRTKRGDTISVPKRSEAEGKDAGDGGHTAGHDDIERLKRFLKGRYTNSIITMKQFAAPSDPFRASYQGLLLLDYYVSDKFGATTDGSNGEAPPSDHDKTEALQSAKDTVSSKQKNTEKGKDKAQGKQPDETDTADQTEGGDGYVDSFPGRCHLRIFEYDSHPIGYVFGFQEADLDPSNRRSYNVEIDHVVYAKDITVQERRGKTLCYRTEAGDWSVTRQLHELCEELRRDSATESSVRSEFSSQPIALMRARRPAS